MPPPHTHLIRNLPLGSSVQGELEGKVHINISNAQDSQSHQELSTAGAKVLENISKLRRMIWVRVEREPFALAESCPRISWCPVLSS